jgi:hypothetical protein
MRAFYGLAGLVAVATIAGCATFTGGALHEPGTPSGELIVANVSGMDIDTLTLSRCSAMSHGLDRLNGQTIPHGTSMTFTLSTGCWDLMVGRSGSCSQSANGQSCRWSQSPSRKFEIQAGGVERITFQP